MTVCKILNEEVNYKKPQPVQFVKALNGLNKGSVRMDDATMAPREYDEILLIRPKNGATSDIYDLMYATRKQATGVFYLGHWNDGFAK